MRFASPFLPVSTTVRLVLLGALALSPAAPLLAEPVISEFVANNAATLDDQDGDSSDWIEIFNPGPGQVNLGGYSLTDDPLVPMKWTFPGNQFLNQGVRLVVFASGKDRSTLGQQYHTNFGLDSGGEYLALVAPDGTVLQEFAPAFPSQKRDIAYGIGNNGTLGYLDPPTPNGPNGAPLTDFVADTVFSHKRGFYSDPIAVRIVSATPGASIRYTTNGTKPSPTFGTLYTGPINISNTTVLRAIAYRAGMVPTNIDAQTYLFSSDIVSQPEMNQSIVTSPFYRNEIRAAIEGLPVVSLSFDDNDLFGFNGIHRNPNDSGRTSEREIHFEFFDPEDALDSTHEPGGVRIHGGNSREHPKKNFRIYFRSDYGKRRLNHDLFGPGVDSFKHLLLRGCGHDAWTFRDDWDQATLLRNEFLHRVQLNMGQPSPRGKMVSLFLNGEYWGVYELQELPHEDYNADTNGGDPDDWDVIKHGQEVEAGNRAAWDDMLSRARGGVTTDEDYDSIQEYVDVDHFADAMMQRIWASDEDWLSPAFRGATNVAPFPDDKNWYVARKSRNGTSRFFFYSWDAEMSMGIPFAAPQAYVSDFTRVNNDNSPGIVYDALRRNRAFQLRFADRLHKHMFNGGALTVPELEPIWDELVDEIRSPIIGESARWGLDAWSGFRFVPFTRDDEWIPATEWVRSQFIQNRSAIVLTQFRGVDLYPNTVAPVLSPQLTASPDPIDVTMSTITPGATIYYTTDGSDPRDEPVFSPIELISSDHQVRAIVPTFSIAGQLGDTWKDRAEPANIGDWLSGPNGVGFEGLPGSSPNYTSLIRTPLNTMQGNNATAWIRYNFNIADQDTINNISQLTLRIRYDDGFIAYLNGVEVESENAISDTWNATASNTHDDADAIIFQSFDISAHAWRLRPGDNVLAIHGLNRTTNNVDFLIQAVLEGTSGDLNGPVAPGAITYGGPVTIDETTRFRARARSGSGEWSALNDLVYHVGTLASPDNLRITEIHYHPVDPLTPEELALSDTDNDFEFLEFQNISGETIDLSVCRFDAGLDFEFPVPTYLPAGERLLLVSNRDAFLARYGNAVEPAIVGVFRSETNLENRGERLRLFDAFGETLLNFRYDEDPPWPLEPDGGGPSLVLIDPPNTPASELGVAARWKASLARHGTPGLPDEVSFALWALQVYGPVDGLDPALAGELVMPPGFGGMTNLQLYAQGWDLGSTGIAGLITTGFTTVDDSEYFTLTFQVRADLTDVAIIPEVSGDLVTWELGTAEVSRTPNGDGTTTVVVRDLVPVDSAGERFMRLRFEK